MKWGPCSSLLPFAEQCRLEPAGSPVAPVQKRRQNGIIVKDPLEHPELVTDCKTLLALRDLLGKGKLQWTEDTPIKQWNGITIDSTRLPLRVTELAPTVRGWSLSGAIPHQLGQLTGLRVLNLDHEDLYGKVPAVLGSLSQLEVLIFSGNNLTGQIPPSLGRLTELKELRLEGNRLTGCLPQIWRDIEVNDLAETGLEFCN